MSFKFHDDNQKAFQPLLDHLKQNIESEDDVNATMYQYMYMGHDEEKTYYKHFANRQYFNIGHDGSVSGQLEEWRKWK